MTKVHPNARTVLSTSTISKSPNENCKSLTVWKKSLLLNCDGFTVFDSKGNLMFRVDKYGFAGEIVLMDASGKPLLTLRRKKLSITENWLIYDGETKSNHVLSMKKRVSILSNKSCLADVMKNGKLVYKIDGSYMKRCCSIYDCDKKRCVAEIKKKEVAVDGVAIGFDVFNLVILEHDLIESSVAMAFVILLDEMFGSSKKMTGSIW
ncbi:protein LURP-one-related 8-like [Impatiens glandulifera]|uniref:protein LURP-one-related 8-like n=1 Tax=Impatiens glandulifera TaxID=253017 RepID=UPI001FB13406|nr:protein LURP-one-related 8-like [Impatiens glandulifera]